MKNKELLVVKIVKGDKVSFAYPNHGFSYDRTHARMHLDETTTYTVANIKVHSVDSDVYLEEVPGVAFNLALFRKVNP